MARCTSDPHFTADRDSNYEEPDRTIGAVLALAMLPLLCLNDLFTDSDLHTFGMPGVPDWSAVMKGCNGTAHDCWGEYIQRRGRMPVRQAWMRAWNLHKDQIYWDAKARCFRLSKD
jgi:hypothetical protein